MKSKACILNLPSEILVKIFEHLNHEDLINSILVCRRWRDVGEDPFLWKEFKLIANVDNIKELNSIITMKRLANIKEVMFENCVLKIVT